MKRVLRRTAAPLLGALVAFALSTSAVPPARAQSGYGQQLSVSATEAKLDIVIQPPAHGQIYNDNGPLGGMDPAEATALNNSYLRSLERGIRDWKRAIQTLGAPWLSSAIQFNTYVVGRDDIPPAVLADPEVIVVTHETAFTNLGTTLVSRPTCVMTHSSWFVYYFTPEDFYNVSSHEFGHCLGVGHVVNDQPALDLMASIYGPDPGARGNPLLCVSTLNMRTVEASYRYLNGQPPLGTSAIVHMPMHEYSRYECGTLATEPPDPPSGSAEPSPGPTEPGPGEPTSQPTSSPTPQASTSPSASPSEDGQGDDYARWVALRKSGHLVLSGMLAADGANEPCTVGVSIDIERRTKAGWRKVGAALSDQNGVFKKKVSDRPGRYRARVPEQQIGDDTCHAATSRVVRHHH